jgi:hypothetical protein
MSLRKPEKPSSLDDVHKFMQDVYYNFSMDDVKAGDLKTAAPTTDTIDKGRSRLVEENGVPKLYYRGTNGTLYLISTGTPV